jgi:tripartite-type tricarboxylate transporter receptor subunit TctC
MLAAYLKSLCTLVYCAAAVAAAPAASAESAFPDRPLTLVVGYPPGGSTDPVARLMAQHMASIMGQTVVVENRAGASGTMGAAHVGRSKPDGYTALFAPNGVSLHPVTLQKTAGYDIRRDLVPVSLVSQGPYVVVVNANLPVNSMAELVTHAKANPRKLFYGTAGVASPLHLLTELLNRSSGMELTHVPYKGNGPMLVGLVGGEIHVAFDTVTSARPLAGKGRLKILAVTGSKRNAMLPNVPTLEEAGIPGVNGTLWQGIFLPKGTPEPIVAKWHAAATESLKVPAVRAMLAEFGFDVIGSTPPELMQRVHSDIAQWDAIVKVARIPLD